MKKYLWIVIVLVVINIVIYLLIPSLNKTKPLEYKTTTLTLSGEVFTTQIADTGVLRERGLSYRNALSQNEAMLFVFEEPGKYLFWMKDMNFSIDIIWLDSSKHMIYVEKNLSPNTYPKAFGPDEQSQYVIEVSAGTFDRLRLHVGDQILF